MSKIDASKTLENEKIVVMEELNDKTSKFFKKLKKNSKNDRFHLGSVLGKVTQAINKKPIFDHLIK